MWEEFNADECFYLGEMILEPLPYVDRQLFHAAALGGAGARLLSLPAAPVMTAGFRQAAVAALCAGLML